jgi:hypothetical protein
MPFRLTNAPATFQCLMNAIFGPHMRKFVLIFMDGILVFIKSLDEHSLMNAIFGPHMRKFVLIFMDDILVFIKSLDEHLDHLRIVF